MWSPSSQPSRSMSKKDMCTRLPCRPHGQLRSSPIAGLAHRPMFLPEASTLIVKATRRPAIDVSFRPESSRAVPGRSSGCRPRWSGRALRTDAGDDGGGRPGDRRARRARLARARRRGRAADELQRATDDGLALELQEMRWALRLTDDAPGRSPCCAWCATTRAAGSRAGAPRGWRAGRASWALGAGGAVDVPRGRRARAAAASCRRSGRRAGSDRRRGAARHPDRHDDADRPGLAARPGAEVTRDHEHDAHAWWPRNPIEWPDEAHPQLRRLATLLNEEPHELPHPQVPARSRTRPSTRPCWSSRSRARPTASSTRSDGRTASAGSSCRCCASTPSGGA